MAKDTESMTKSLLSDLAILEAKDAGNIVIHPFRPTNLSTSSYDVVLGPYFFRESSPAPGRGVYNPYCKDMVDRVWGQLKTAERAGEWVAENGIDLENISPEDQIIWIAPGETILGHTDEFIGGRSTITTMMKARSSMGRNFIEVCKCAGWGDIGYYSIPLVVGRRIAQIIFFDTVGTVGKRQYGDSGKYQGSQSVEELCQNWTPTDMLPKMYLDREITRVQ